MARNPFPSFDWYARDWLSSEARATMTAEQRAGYLDLLSHAWLGDPPCSLPNDDRALALLSGLGEDKWLEAGPIIRQWFVEKGERLVNPRLVAHYRERTAIRRQKSEAGKEGGRKSAETRAKRGKQRLGSASPLPLAESKPSPSPSPSPYSVPTERRNGHKSYEPGSTDDLIWNSGVTYLETHGCNNARSFLGMLRKEHTDKVIAGAVGIMLAERPSDAPAFLRKTIQRRDPVEQRSSTGFVGE